LRAFTRPSTAAIEFRDELEKAVIRSVDAAGEGADLIRESVDGAHEHLHVCP